MTEIKGKIIMTMKNNRTKKWSVLIEIDGKQKWFPKSVVKEGENGIILIETWFLNK